MKKETGTLYLVATPIGNLEDMTFRAVRILKEADLIAAEDTRNSIKLLNHFDIHTPMTSYHEFNKLTKADFLVAKLIEGNDIALITDAGTPGISDPGEELVSKCVEAGVKVSPVPGPAACISGLIVSGLKTDRFAFEAFLPRDKKDREKVLTYLENEKRSIVIYEAPHRLKKTLQELKKHLPEGRKISLVRELTKRHEEVIRTDIGSVVSLYDETDPLGEYVLVIEGKTEEEEAEESKALWADLTIKEHVLTYINQGKTRKEAMKAVARDRGIAKNIVYKDFIDDN